ncbi:MAG: c-type cytochrome biogenesis protein CcmI [Oceanococcus sp.]
MNEMIWLIGGLIALASGLWLVIGMMIESRKLGSQLRVSDRARLNAKAYKEQIKMLEQRHADDEIDQAQFEQARTQLEETTLKELEQDKQDWLNKPWPLVGKLTVVVAIIGIALASYQFSNGQQHSSNPAPVNAPASVEAMVATLAQKLEENPDDLEGWVMLGRSYSVMRRYGQSAYAYHQANELTQQSEAELLVAEAEALGLAAGQNLTGQPMTLITKALSLDENNVRGLWYALLAATQTGDEALKKSYLQRLEAQQELPTELADILRKEFSASLTIDQPKLDGEDKAAYLNLTIRVDPQLVAQLPNNATLFVFAKAQQGSPMPLAVSRQALPREWPIQVRLDDSMGMLENMSLSNFDAWTIVARISQSGLAQAQSGDWQVSLNVNAADGPNQSLTISRQVP